MLKVINQSPNYALPTLYKKLNWEIPFCITRKDTNFYDQWYILNVRTGREKYIQEYIDYYSQSTIQTISFKRELIHKKGNRFQKTINTLFPGYIFVHKEIKLWYTFLRDRSLNEYMRPIAFNGHPLKVNTNEMKLLLSNVDSTGTFRMSYGIQKGKGVKIIDGPLKNIEENILFINKRKRKAKVKIELFNREMFFSLGLDFIEVPKS